MKKTVLILGLFAFSFGALAQDKSEVKQSDLKGPEYKNFKSWMHKAVPTNVQSASTATELQGPAYKNQRFNRNTQKTEMATVATIGSEQQKLKGAEYKNYSSHKRAN
ncbi:hypothetical protein [Pedobacter glucosidilyticus]|uniref:hypothetical protein n=1 Tax=Pedobacter glucosidilyticus TaxID=1122941 RepID=UPI0004074180|nr:hypothetical protein [Pedobacter glucosidilyticus]